MSGTDWQLGVPNSELNSGPVRRVKRSALIHCSHSFYLLKGIFRCRRVTPFLKEPNWEGIADGTACGDIANATNETYTIGR